jgi:hypothetical protein
MSLLAFGAIAHSSKILFVQKSLHNKNVVQKSGKMIVRHIFVACLK